MLFNKKGVASTLECGREEDEMHLMIGTHGSALGSPPKLQLVKKSISFLSLTACNYTQ